MFLERRKVGDSRRFFVVGASGFAVYFLLGMTPAWGQQEVKAPVVQTLASSNTSLNYFHHRLIESRHHGLHR